MGLSVIYTAAGEPVGARHYKKNPDLVLLDTDILAKAPIRFLVAGMGDALSTYPECRANVQSASPNYVNSGYHQTIACIAVSLSLILILPAISPASGGAPPDRLRASCA